MVNENSKCETWDFKPLNDYLDLLTDYDANGSFADMAANVHTEWGHGYAWYVRATDLEQNLSMADVRYADEYSYKFLEKTSLFGGELLMAKRGEIGKIYFFQMRSKYATLAPNLYLLKLNDGMDSRFLYYYFLSGEGQKKIKAINASTSLGAIYKDDVKRILVPELDIKEQKQIAETLSGIDSLISKLQELIVKKKNMRQGTMQLLITGKKRLLEFDRDSEEKKSTEAGEIPKTWNCKKIGNFTDVFSGGTPDTKNSDYWGGDIPWMNSGELHLKYVKTVEGRITEKGLNNSSAHMIPKNCVLIGLAGQGKTRGTAAINFMSLCTNQSIAAIYPSDEHDALFLFYVMDSKYSLLREISSGEGGRGGLTKALIKNVSVQLPPLPEQRAIAKILFDIDTEIEKHEKKLQKYKKIKQGMMEELLTGKVRLV